MLSLPNGVTVFNATPHPIRFWSEDWAEPVEVQPDEVINATVEEQVISEADGITFVSTVFQDNREGWHLVGKAEVQGATVIVGSIIAAQAYPLSQNNGHGVVALVPCAGYERVPPTEKRMRPDKFTVF